MKKIDLFTNCYPLLKTLRFSLIPVGKTEDNFNSALLLESDKQRADDYKKVKKYIDRCHREFIEKVLSKVYLDDVKEYAKLYHKSNKSDEDNESMEILELQMRKVIAKAFEDNELYKSLFGQDLIKKILPDFVEIQEEKEAVAMFRDFATYFVGFFENRKNMYTFEAQSTAIAYRCINENLPKFLDNVLSFKKINEVLPEEKKTILNSMCMELYGVYVEDMFKTDYFSFTLSQSGIDKYNTVIGGYTEDDGTKIQGLNEYINLYNQQVAKNDKSKKLPMMKELYKQILSDSEKLSFIPESYESDNAVIESIKNYFKDYLDSAAKKIGELFEKFEDFNMDGVFVKSGSAITDISNQVFGDWSAVSRGWNALYEEIHPIKNAKNTEKYFENERKEYNKIQSFSISELQKLGGKFKTENVLGDIVEFYKNSVKEKIETVIKKYDDSKDFLNSDYTANNAKKLCRNEEIIKTIKELLDSVKELEHLIKPLLGTGKESGKDEVFYGEFLHEYEKISLVDGLYDKVRNYVTQKPYSINKIKLNFENSHFLGGWTQNFETKGAILFKKENKYYIGIINKKFSETVQKELYENASESSLEHIVYDFQKPDNKNTPRLFIRSKGTSYAPSVKEYNLPIEDIIDIYDNGYFKTGYRDKNPAKYKDSLTKIIDYFKLGFTRHESYKHFQYAWKPSIDYTDIAEFYKDTISSCYNLYFKKVNEKYLNSMVDNGQIYLFQIYNKDFSKHSHGNPNLHTLYFKMLFDEKNLSDVVYQLSGGAEMFYREASINKEEMIIHKANEPIKNKNVSNPKRESVFEYDLIKDKRFTKNQFSLHLPITLNFKADGQNFINTDVRQVLKNSESNYVIGIDRGERNLLYICVIDDNGKIVYQKSLNEIISGKDNNYKVDYHKLLDSKEKDRDDARKAWGTIENIKELKEGYLSQIVHEICNLVLKYDAVIAMEDLNFGFKKGRFKVEKQVYQKFENMLISKLNFLVSKSAKPEEKGGLLNAYQLTNKVDGVNKAKQNGFIFYVPAWLTSKIDPVTGFADLIKPRYTSMAEAKSLIDSIDDIRYNSAEDMFEFEIDYEKFPKAYASHRKLWTVYTNGERIVNYRNKEKNEQWDNKTMVLTEEFKALFEKQKINYTNNLKEQVLSQTTSEFFKDFIRLFANTLQMRNSETGNGDVDYLISPVKDECGNFYDSRNFVGEESQLPENADANGAYNIARKAQWAISVLKKTPNDELKKADLSIKNSDWLEYVQK